MHRQHHVVTCWSTGNHRKSRRRQWVKEVVLNQDTFAGWRNRCKRFSEWVNSPNKSNWITMNLACLFWYYQSKLFSGQYTVISIVRQEFSNNTSLVHSGISLVKMPLVTTHGKLMVHILKKCQKKVIQTWTWCNMTSVDLLSKTPQVVLWFGTHSVVVFHSVVTEDIRL